MSEEATIEQIIEEDMNKRLKHIDDEYRTLSGNVDWFAFETRIRQIIFEFLEPSTKRIVETKNTIESVINQNEFLRRRVDELEFILHKSHKRNLVHDNLDKRITKIEEKMTDFTHEIANEMENVKFHQNLNREKITIIEQNYEAVSRKWEDIMERSLKLKSELSREINLRVIY